MTATLELILQFLKKQIPLISPLKHVNYKKLKWLKGYVNRQNTRIAWKLPNFKK